MPTTAEDTNWAEHVADLPPRVRQSIAAARNTQIRVTALKLQMLEEGAKLATQVKRLHKVDGLNPYRIGRCLGISRNRVLEILAKK